VLPKTLNTALNPLPAKPLDLSQRILDRLVHNAHRVKMRDDSMLNSRNKAGA
jgi:hypothetical protein